MAIKPEDILPDAVNTVVAHDVTVRKGSVGAVLANAKILASTTATTQEKQLALAAIEELMPALVALDMHEHVVWKNPQIQEVQVKTAMGFRKK